jgi:hypothetical protein
MIWKWNDQIVQAASYKRMGAQDIALGALPFRIGGAAAVIFRHGST